MPRFETALFAEFVQESLELLSRLGAACGELSTSEEPDAQLATIDRGLHTIKGNSAALGFAKLSRAAGRVLDEVRREAPSGTLSADCMGKIWKFLVECRQYLAHVSNERAPGEDLLSADGESDYGIEPLGLSDDLPVALEARELTIEEILAAVPELLSPDVGRLMGKRPAPEPDLSALEPSTLGQLAARSDQPDDSQALRAAAQLGRLKAHALRLRSAGISEDEIIPIRRFLTQLRDRSRQFETEPMDKHLRAVANDIQALGSEMGIPLQPTTRAGDMEVLPALGTLVRHLLTELIRLRLEAAVNKGRSLELDIQAEDRSGRLEIQLNGLAFAGRPSALERVRLQASLEFLDDLDGSVRNDSADGSLVLSLATDGLFSLKVCVVNSSDGRYCLPSDRVLSKPNMGPHVELAVAGESRATTLTVDSVSPAQEMLVVASPEDLCDGGILGYALSFANSERIPVLDPDSL